MGRKHGTLAKAGKVRKQTPKVAKMERQKKIVKGRAMKRIKYKQRFLTVVEGVKKRTPNWHAGNKEIIEQDRIDQKKRKELADARKQK